MIDEANDAMGDMVDELEDEFEDDEFDAFFSERMRSSLDAAGPSIATEERILMNLLAARGAQVGESITVANEPAAPVDDVARQTVSSIFEEELLLMANEGAQPAEPVQVAPVEAAPFVEPAQVAPVEPAQVIAEVVPPVIEAPVPAVAEPVAFEPLPPVVELSAETSPVMPAPPAPAVVEQSVARPDGLTGTDPLPVQEVNDALAAQAADSTEQLSVVESPRVTTAEVTNDLSDVAETVGGKRRWRVSKPLTYLAAAASVAAFALVIGISSLRFGQAPEAAATKDASAIVAMESADAASEEAPVSYAVPEGEPEAEEAASVQMEDKAEDSATNNVDVDALEVVSEEAEADAELTSTGAAGGDAPYSLALQYPTIEVSKDLDIEIVMGKTGPEVVDASAVGEFIKQVRVTDGNEKTFCEVYHVIAQSDYDNELYVVRYINDGTFYLAKPVA